MKLNKEEFNKTLKDDWEEIKKKPIQTIYEFLKQTIIIFLITIIILYFISRPYECEIKETNKTIHIEEMKFEIKEIKECKYNIIKDTKNIIKAIREKPEINITEEQPWEMRTQ